MRPDLAALGARLPPRPLTRFAPSPTYYLHLGHVVNAIYVWGIARALDGRVLLRIEDHDRTRCRPGYERAILEDLAWLGLKPDVGSFASFRAGVSPWRQSDQEPLYAAMCRRLAATHHVFACACSRKDIVARGDGDDAACEPRYPGTCRAHRVTAAAARPDAGPAGTGLRVVMDAGVETFDDALLGPRAQDPARQCGDLLIRDRHGCWTYQFCAAIDDWRHGVDLVIRGSDLLASTGRQLRLARMLGRPDAPVFLHHPLVMKASGEKVSKSNRDTGVRDLRAAGLTAAEVLGRAAHACGLIPEPEPVVASDLARLFR